MFFKHIQGQDQALDRIRRDLEQGREASAYLFCGPAGAGKLEAARSFARAVNCLGGSSGARCECPSCMKIDRGEHPDVHTVACAPDEEITVDDIRVIRETIGLKAYEGRRTVFIIDHAHNFNQVSGNALLKTIEEPPKGSTLILLTDKPSVLLKTIVSRCRTIRFAPLGRSELERILCRDHGAVSAQAHFLAFFSEGRLGFALQALREGRAREIDVFMDEFLHKHSFPPAQDRQAFSLQLNMLAGWFRDVYVAKAGVPDHELMHAGRSETVRQWADRCGWEDLERALNALSSALLYTRQNVNVKLLWANLRASLP